MTLETLKFKIGDVVRLKSGGPNMTVSEYDTSETKNIVHISFFASDYVSVIQYSFDESLLEKVNLNQIEKI